MYCVVLNDHSSAAADDVIMNYCVVVVIGVNDRVKFVSRNDIGSVILKRIV